MAGRKEAGGNYRRVNIGKGKDNQRRGKGGSDISSSSLSFTGRIGSRAWESSF